MPLFSVVIPVRDRAAMLRYAIRSVLNQAYGDFEIVVSDNCSSDGTPDVVKEFNDSRIRYIRTPKRLPMHENYEFAFNNAKGEWIICLTSRFVMWRRALEVVAKTIRDHAPVVINWPYGLYYTDTWFEPQRRNTMVLYHPYSTGVVTRRADATLRNMFNLSYHDFDVPQPGYSAYHHSVLERVRNRFGRIFFLPAPDRTSCAAVLRSIDAFCTIPMPLMLSGTCAESNGASFLFPQGKEYVKFFSEYREENMLTEVPARIHASIVHTVESFLRVKAMDPDGFPGLELNVERFFAACFTEILDRERKGIEVSAAKKELFSALAKQPAALQRTVRNRLPRIAVSVRLKGLAPLIDGFRGGRALTHYLTKRQVVTGGDGGFSDIMGAEACLDTIVGALWRTCKKEAIR